MPIPISIVRFSIQTIQKMKLLKEEFEVLDFNVNGISEIDESYYLLKMSNPVEHDTQWQIAANAPIGILIIEATYTPKNKVDMSNICFYKTLSKYTFQLGDYKNEEDVISSVVTNLYDNLSKEYNNRIKGTKMQIPFPAKEQGIADLTRQRILASLHKGLERIQNLR